MKTGPRLALLVLALGILPCLTSCASTPEFALDVTTQPAGAAVYVSRRGEKAVQGQLGPVSGDVDAEELVEEFVYLGDSPVQFRSPLTEDATNASVLGVGVVVERRYREGVVRVEMPGYETVERRVRFHNGRMQVDVQLQPAVPASPQR